MLTYLFSRVTLPSLKHVSNAFLSGSEWDNCATSLGSYFCDTFNREQSRRDRFVQRFMLFAGLLRPSGRTVPAISVCFQGLCYAKLTAAAYEGKLSRFIESWHQSNGKQINTVPSYSWNRTGSSSVGDFRGKDLSFVYLWRKSPEYNNALHLLFRQYSHSLMEIHSLHRFNSRFRHFIHVLQYNNKMQRVCVVARKLILTLLCNVLITLTIW